MAEIKLRTIDPWDSVVCPKIFRECRTKNSKMFASFYEEEKRTLVCTLLSAEIRLYVLVSKKNVP